MNIPKITVNLNKALDLQYLIEFFQGGNPLISEHYPFLKTEKDCNKLIEFIYDHKLKELKDTKKYILSKKNILQKVCTQLANIIETDWVGIEEINIIPAICPVCPRFIESNTFLVTYFYNKGAILRICAHEMSHFIYFKKIRQLITDEIIETEYPSKDWLLSEIITPLIINSDELQKYLSQQDEFFASSKIKNIDRTQERIKSEFDRRKNFDDLIIKARSNKNILQSVKL